MDEPPLNEQTDLASLNPHLTCKLCHGYLIDAVSITECLHPFCKSCIVKHLATKNTCPECGIIIHQSHPLNYISADRTLQDIVYKIVPNLKEVERKNRADFYRSIGRSPPPNEDFINEYKALSISQNTDCSNKNIPSDSPSSDSNYHRDDDCVYVKLESGSESLKPLRLKYLRISSKATVTHLRKYIALKIFDDISRFKEIDLFILNSEAGTFLGRDHVLKFVQVVYWNDFFSYQMGDSANPFGDRNESNEPTSPPKKTSRFTTFIVPESNDDSTISTNFTQTKDLSTKIIRTPPYNEFLAAHSKSTNRRNDGHSILHKPEGQQYDDFETIDWVKDIACDRDRHRRIHSDKNTLLGKLRIYWNSASGWICVSLVGIAVGLIAALIDIGSPWLTDLKEGICLDALWFNRAQCCWSSDVPGEDCPEWYSWSRLMMNKDPSGENPSAYFVSYVVFVLWAIVFSTLCVAFVRMFAPYACGSGIPEIKTILSGFIIRGYLGKWTLLVKSMGMILGVSAGLSLGKEGPMVHMASCCGNILSYLFPKYSKNEAKKREILSAAAAAGVAVAFGAPIGGVLFSLEEASYYFPMKTMFRSFFCAMVSANLVRMINPYGDEHLVMFQIDYKAQWHIAELIPFAILGIMGGIFGTLFNRSNLFICRLRKTTWLGQYPVREVLLVTLATAVLSYPLPYMRMNMGDLVRLMVSRCGPGDLGALCDYKVNLSDTQATIMGNYPAGSGISRAMWMLAVTLILKAIITVFTFGIKVPTGLFIPSLAVGAMMGRMLGVGIEQLVVYHADHPLVQRMCKSAHPCINPGLYALVGAASTLGGVTRMTISLVVVMLELTGGLTYILPLMVAAMVSKWTGDRLTNGSIYEEHIRLNKYPYLSSREELIHTSIAADVMQPKAQTSPLLVVTQNSMTVGDIEFLLSSSTYKGFPVVVSEESQYLVGWITRRDLTRALEQEKLYNPDVATDSMVYFTDSNSAGDFGLPTNVANLSTIVDLSPITVTDQTPMETVLDFFRKLGLRQVLVTKNG
ncbi:unnamed protein product [Hymenolepis diminuta]|uniref:Chloride channel protein n=2 Tax=Hymenolepis diminuta TaxID=6216 RepID=A0A158QC87_HYMDI|nr:unnamed protein product [Hymenolepis diminuta]